MSSLLPDFANELLHKIAQENGFKNFCVGIENGAQPGDNFSSELFRVKILENESSKELELMCKMAPSNENHRKDFSSDKSFKREAFFYQNLMPTLAKFQEEKQLPKSEQFQSYPKCYGAIIDDEKQQYIIVLEDLRPLDFKLWDKSKPTTIENARITMRELGKFHGLSIAFKDQKPNAFNEFKQLKNLLPELLKPKNFLGMLENSHVKAADLLKNENHKSIALHIKSNIFPFISHCFDEKVSNCIGVFCHGDCWNNNILFRFNNKKFKWKCDAKEIPEEIRFVDWQMCHFGPPAIDLHYNIFTSTDKALRDKEYKNLIKLYYKSLSKTVKLLGSNPKKLFTYKDLLGDLKRCGVYALLMTPILLQISLADSSETVDMDEMFDKVAEGEGQIDLISGLSTKGQSEYDRRLNEVFEDVIKLGYYQQSPKESFRQLEFI